MHTSNLNWNEKRDGDEMNVIEHTQKKRMWNAKSSMNDIFTSSTHTHRERGTYL